MRHQYHPLYGSENMEEESEGMQEPESKQKGCEINVQRRRDYGVLCSEWDTYIPPLSQESEISVEDVWKDCKN